MVLILGDSLSAAYGIDVNAGWVALLKRRFEREGYPYQVVNASISGETTGGGRRRLAELLARHEPRLVVVELGANDGLRGIPLQDIADNLTAICRATRAAGASVIVLRMVLPPNYGPDYTHGFDAIYDSLKDEKHDVFVAPFFLADVLSADLLQADGLHPTAAAQPRMLDAVWPTISAHVRENTNEVP